MIACGTEGRMQFALVLLELYRKPQKSLVLCGGVFAIYRDSSKRSRTVRPEHRTGESKTRDFLHSRQTVRDPLHLCQTVRDFLHLCRSVRDLRQTVHDPLRLCQTLRDFHILRQAVHDFFALMPDSA